MAIGVLALTGIAIGVATTRRLLHTARRTSLRLRSRSAAQMAELILPVESESERCRLAMRVAPVTEFTNSIVAVDCRHEEIILFPFKANPRVGGALVEIQTVHGQPFWAEGPAGEGPLGPVREALLAPRWREEANMAKWMEFEKCAGCGWDIGTGEGEPGCAWGECAYLPQELDVFCEGCRFNYFTLQGNPPCDDPLVCEHAAVPLSHVENYRRWAAARGIEVGAP